MKIVSKDHLIYIMHNVKEVKYDKGGLWEENQIKIAYNYPIYCADSVNCTHLGPKYTVRDFRNDGTHFDTIYANCPRVIIAENEGGFNSTGVCLDCVLENIEKGE